MKQTLQLKIGQQLTMTPQLQQAIKLLQLSTLDLQQEIQAALDSNPLLEAIDDEIEESTDNTQLGSAMDDANYQSSDDHSDTSTELAQDEWSDHIPTELAVDTQWDDIYQNGSTEQSNNTSDFSDFDYKNTHQETLQERLYWQLNLTPLVDSDRAIAMTIIDSISPTGFLTNSAQEIFDSIAEELDIDFEDFEAVRKLIQQFDPIGVASEDLRDCLLIQLNVLPPNTPFVNDAKLIVDRYLPFLGNHDYAQIKKRTKFKDGRLKEAIGLILTLSPQPGDIIDAGTTEYIAPDVYVKKQQGRWVVELSSECSVKLRINNEYASMIQRSNTSADNTYLKDNLQEARWFIKSLESRNQTLLKVANKIVEYQRAFLDYGEEAMKPLILSIIAQDIDMHESTISRVTTKKYMHTPRGIFELKYFFSSHVSTDMGGECSSTAIRAIIKKHISEENTLKPLSDSKITELLANEGINVARRTVAKYRESMSIAPSNERKRLV